MSAEAIFCRPLRETDFPGVMTVQAERYDGRMLEPEATLVARWIASPDTAWVALDESGICAYLFGYRSILGRITPLRGLFEPAPQANTFYLHDLAVSRRAHGIGIGTRLVRLGWELARREGVPHSSLVSLESARTFWHRLGYRIHALTDPEQHDRLRGYEENDAQAFHMALDLDA